MKTVIDVIFRRESDSRVFSIFLLAVFLVGLAINASVIQWLVAHDLVMKSSNWWPAVLLGSLWVLGVIVFGIRLILKPRTVIELDELD